MSEPVDVLILNALLGKLVPVATVGTSDITSPATPVSSPLVLYTPTAGVAYLGIHPVLRAAPQSPALAFVGSTLRRGIFQVDAVVPDGNGEAPGIRLASLVAARFPAGLVLSASPYKIQLLKVPTIAAAVKDAPWVRFPVSIPYLVIA